MSFSFFLDEFAKAFLYNILLLGLPFMLMMASDDKYGDPLHETSQFDNLLEWGMALFVFIVLPILIALKNINGGI